jgi:hypothetical protein
MALKQHVKDEMIREWKKIQENKLLMWGIFLGIIGSLIAGVIQDIVRTTTFYPWKYLIVLVGLFIIAIYFVLKAYIGWKFFQHKLNKKIEGHRKVIQKYKVLKQDIKRRELNK